jgi:ribosome production factor 1
MILNNFTTRLGHRVGRFLGSLYKHEPNFKGREVVTFHNQRDFIFVRHHRYIFQGEVLDKTKARLQELGPRFTLKMKWLQEGTFDTQHGEYEWFHKRKQMDKTRRTFHL